ncbi:NifB/NifX family molybdenum-iron cluster-binding protein [Desulfofundulus thermosubterraneus]|uniref:Predicted Fe-Mo cluster-binding protein, NifX family n=1 Tax=Desulfofundulus thermosubterraneus DSM 16057 TaxID=1121432 RepID=A0A1M6JQF5_9FIRM|nr:NifB/NifX family molybdenum-iron cluster-binding protein [Desulfofundulus thermosubterraneus]SHJ48949.1 Predicted Fe-Mo cluster-binding protein, NifX family [Desulfofundulus thermosubterraneus DSM 16057]
MIVALARWGGRISPLFDVTQEALVVDIGRGGLISRRQVRLDDPGWPSRVEQMVHLGVEVLICGGISNFLYHQLVARGIQVIPWVTGDVEEVLQAYLQGRLNQERYAMPGCRRWRHRHRGTP